ncbi:HIT family protein [Bacillus mycoides]|uniref:HIT family protein n=2 Tax=Bacillus mycoides TaxID=1405 RepID=UPI001C01DA2F|nr:HIT family protein [Bacillus mycoides]QWG73464.1 HIT family protein [Bacillus mycoides]QWH25753.1 HIT family protein [Bacillus mycoides]
MDSCVICRNHCIKKNIIFEGKHMIVSLGAVESQVLGYIYVEPRRHIESWYELTSDEMLDLGLIIQKVSLFLKRELKAERVYTVTISEVVRHLHIHVIPREKHSDIKGLSLIEQATQQKVIRDKKVPEQAVEILKKKMQAFLKSEFEVAL